MNKSQHSETCAPKPSAQELERSNHLSEKIKNVIEQQGGFISFSTFMEMALYEPTLGYYNALDLTIGKDGDFTTAPEISPLFAKCFAQQCKEIWDSLGDKSTSALLELGAGTGRFAKDILAALDEMNSLPNHYYIYEKSHALRQKQNQLLCREGSSFAKKITWLDHLPKAFKGIIIANEVLDAIPIHCFSLENNVIKERCVSIEANQFIFTTEVPTTALLTEAVQKLSKLYEWPKTYASEINLHLSPFIKNLSDILKKGVILLADYGYGECEYYHPQRSQGTLMSFYQHRQYHHPLWHPGLFDITAHVNFTHVADSALNAGANLLGYTTQASFLLACGLLDFAQKIEKNLSQKDEFILHQAIKLLTMPTEMGERCKIIALGKAIDFPLRGFAWHDRRRDL